MNGDILRSLGRHLGRAKFQRGTLSRVPRRAAPGKTELWWQARYLDYASLNQRGKPKRKKVWLGPIAHMGKAEAQKRLDGLIARAHSAEPVVDVDPTFTRWWERWTELKSGRWSEGTTRSVLPSFKNHVLPTIGQLRLVEITKERLQALLNSLAKQYSRSVVKTVRTYLKASLEDAVENDLLTKNPTRQLELPRTRRPDESVLTKEQIAALLGQLFGRDRVVFRLFTVCGFRPGEVFCFRRGDWSNARGALRVDETVYEGKITEPKTEASNAWVFVPPATAAELQAWLDTTDGGPDDWMFPSRTGRPLRHASYLKWVLRPAAKRAGIVKIDFRMLRRSCAPYAQRHATVKDTQAQLRHADPTITLRFYQKEIPESVKQAFTAMDAELFPDDGTENIQSVV